MPYPPVASKKMSRELLDPERMHFSHVTVAWGQTIQNYKVELMHLDPDSQSPRRVQRRPDYKANILGEDPSITIYEQKMDNLEVEDDWVPYTRTQSDQIHKAVETGQPVDIACEQCTNCDIYQNYFALKRACTDETQGHHFVDTGRTFRVGLMQVLLSDDPAAPARGVRTVRRSTRPAAAAHTDDKCKCKGRGYSRRTKAICWKCAGNGEPLKMNLDLGSCPDCNGMGQHHPYWSCCGEGVQCKVAPPVADKPVKAKASAAPAAELAQTNASTVPLANESVPVNSSESDEDSSSEGPPIVTVPCKTCGSSGGVQSDANNWMDVHVKQLFFEANLNEIDQKAFWDYLSSMWTRAAGAFRYRPKHFHLVKTHTDQVRLTSEEALSLRNKQWVEDRVEAMAAEAENWHRITTETFWKNMERIARQKDPNMPSHLRLS